MIFIQMKKEAIKPLLRSNKVYIMRMKKRKRIERKE